MKIESNNKKIQNQRFENLSFIKANHTFKGVATRVTLYKVSHGLFVLYKGTICHGEYTTKPSLIHLYASYPRLEYVQAMVNFGIITQDEFDKHVKDTKEARKNYLEHYELVSCIESIEKLGVRVPKALKNKLSGVNNG